MTSETPIIAKRRPAIVDLQPGVVYRWCACGRSEDQPWCDESHRGTGLGPIEIVVDEPTRVALCQCKQSGKRPHCDGRHGDV
ncbi:MAG: CDGSH iron-sulfur domain-containing protein [Chloroflexi bacterium]|nr:CDGSH iron-sulfur domain-containing protein [Chloroflexota bacterium]